MIEQKDIEKLARLARIEISAEEQEILRSDIEAIVGYVSQIKEAAPSELIKKAGVLRNVMRQDGEPHPRGAFTETLLEEVPEQTDGYVKVKQIL